MSILFVFVAIVCSGCGGDSPSTGQPADFDSQEALNLAQHHWLMGNHQQAMRLAREVLIVAPENSTALNIVARGLAAEYRFMEAAELISRAAESDETDSVANWLLAFDWHLRSGNDDECEQDLRKAIATAPDDPRGHRYLSQWLNCQGRRYEAAQHVILLEKLGGMTHAEAMSLIDIGGPFQLIDFGDLIKRESLSLFDLARARALYDRGKNVPATIRQVSELSIAFPDSPAIAAFHGRLLVSHTDATTVAAWLKNVPKDIDGHPEYWYTLGSWLLLQNRDQEAIRAFGEAVRLDPTDRRSLGLLAAALDRIGEGDHAKKVQQTLGVLDKIMRLSSIASAADSIWVAEQLQRLARPWESLAWYRYAFELKGELEQRKGELQDRREKILQWENSGNRNQIRNARLSKMLGFEVDRFPMTNLAQMEFANPTKPARSQLIDFRFEDVASAVGITTTFVSGFPADGKTVYLYQANGGGIAALDFDLDGRCDFYFVQSGGDPRKPNDSEPNQLYRQVAGNHFIEVSVPSAANDRNFGQGVCAADINQDGFADLLVANIGRNSLYINQGDGTFRDQSQLIGDNLSRWTSSMAVGDLDGDSLPDLVEVNYLDDPSIFNHPCHHQQQDCTPQRFRAGRNRILRNVGDGSLSVWEKISEADVLPNFGMGIVLSNFDLKSGNDIFVSNDGDVNQYWKSKPAETSHNPIHSSPFTLEECASISGCSVGRSGYSQACMGVASGDFDRNGLLDLLVTNFYDEPVNLFLQNHSGFFLDEAFNRGLVEHSTKVLGFGTQAADFDNDGWLDVAVLNGHLYNAQYAGVPFKMSAQLFHGGPDGFALAEPSNMGDYWQREQLGRSLVLADYNADGRIDLVSNHLDLPVAVLQNDSPSGNWLQLELVAINSERLAIGATVTIHANGNRWSSWRTSGDGYMVTNEAMLHFGIGQTDSVEKLEIHWPSGMTQVFNSVKVNHRYLAIEGEESLYSR